jgi:hypothetical protein
MVTGVVAVQKNLKVGRINKLVAHTLAVKKDVVWDHDNVRRGADDDIIFLAR